MRNDRPASPLVLRATVIASRAVRTFVAAGQMLQHTFEQAVLHGTTPAERQQITIALYDQTTLYANRAPFAWERPWFTTALGDPSLANHFRRAGRACPRSAANAHPRARVPAAYV